MKEMLLGFREVKRILVGGMTSGLAGRDGQESKFSKTHYLNVTLSYMFRLFSITSKQTDN